MFTVLEFRSPSNVSYKERQVTVRECCLKPTPIALPMYEIDYKRPKKSFREKRIKRRENHEPIVQSVSAPFSNSTFSGFYI